MSAGGGERFARTATSGFTRAYPGNQSVPNATFMNFAQNQDITNTGTIALATTGNTDLKVRNYGGASQYVIDIQGYYIDPAVAAGAVYVPQTPCRVVDTRGHGESFANREIRGYTITGTGTVFTNQGGKTGGCAIPDNALARRFRDAAGRLHQQLAARADRVVLTVAGLPLLVKPFLLKLLTSAETWIFCSRRRSKKNGTPRPPSRRPRPGP